MKREELRHQIWKKYNGHCAYCGKQIEYKDMQVDHVIPQAMLIYEPDKYTQAQIYDISNLIPACKSCNHYKRSDDLEQFRRLMLTLHERIICDYISRVAIDYGIIEVKPFEGKFYFEKINNL